MVWHLERSNTATKRKMGKIDRDIGKNTSVGYDTATRDESGEPLFESRLRSLKREGAIKDWKKENEKEIFKKRNAPR